MSSQATLTGELSANGLLPQAWATSFTAIDRAEFVPAHCWANTLDGATEPLDREEDPARWEAAVYSDQPIVTQLDDGATTWPETSGNATSSASQPSLVLEMLDSLDIQDGDRVLEIGTGTGYNAALLAHRLGDSQVTTVEVDPDLTEQARAALLSLECRPTVICGDGGDGYLPNAPYDRILATASVLAGHVPTAWVEQVDVGGQILLPWKTMWGSGVLVRMVVKEDGTAVGPVLGDAFFMNLRSQRTPFGQAGKFGRLADEATDAPVSSTIVAPHEVAIDPDGAFTVGLHLADVQHSIAYEDPEHYELLLYQVNTGSWATVEVTAEHTAEGKFPVRQHGPRELWSEAEAAHNWWIAQGRPARTSYGLLVSGQQQSVWLNHPDNPVTGLI
ncbi:MULTISPECIES: methyltransferase domain-containing protein [unclassified Crossiella]|uniref:methyltransferase domain-containing protein n=1 Tax=unclassified Crossiella TaxID=2620835 RepID=UPI001FFE9470|nr:MULTISPECIES: methyltransferase domain-containing protein [unclassified Crossiella]MCK2240040.1 methyltransferase domain-containing protein [Crossiella sp. S99.2]MCK2252748.1 methyltransferase domain-containing protein [Crossiella sp. S99.1]